MIETAPRSNVDMSYEEAWLYSITLYYNGYSDWRLPTRDDYLSSLEPEPDPKLAMSCWYKERYDLERKGYHWAVTPVRDKK